MPNKKMGRPTTNPKNEELKVRISKEDKEKLEYCINNSNITNWNNICCNRNV